MVYEEAMKAWIRLCILEVAKQQLVYSYEHRSFARYQASGQHH